MNFSEAREKGNLIFLHDDYDNQTSHIPSRWIMKQREQIQDFLSRKLWRKEKS